MPLVGEQAWFAWAYEFGGDPFTVSVDLDFAPSAAFIKVFLERYFEFGDKSAVDIGLMNIRFRDPNDVDQTITFPDLNVNAPTPVAFNLTMTHVTFGLRVSDVEATLVWTLGFWA